VKRHARTRGVGAAKVSDRRYSIAWRTRPARTWTKVRPKAVLALYSQPGASMRSVARELGVSTSTVRDAVLAAGGVMKPVGDVEGKAWRAYHARRKARTRCK
jgi:hypothetical protein